MEPERNIEKLLRAFGRKRREQAGAPLELHPATRRLLQGEVARSAGPARQGRGPVGWLRFRPGLVFGVCLLALAGIFAAMLLPALSKAKSKASYAQQQTKAMPYGEADSSPAPAAEPNPTLVPQAPALAESGKLESYEAPVAVNGADRKMPAGQTAAKVLDAQNAPRVTNSLLMADKFKLAKVAPVSGYAGSAGDGIAANPAAGATALTGRSRVESDLAIGSNQDGLLSWNRDGPQTLAAARAPLLDASRLGVNAFAGTQVRVDAGGSHVQVIDRLGRAYDGYRQADVSGALGARRVLGTDQALAAKAPEKKAETLAAPPAQFWSLRGADTNQVTAQNFSRFLFTNGVPPELRTNDVAQTGELPGSWTGYFLIPLSNSTSRVTGELQWNQTVPLAPGF